MVDYEPKYFGMSTNLNISEFLEIEMITSVNILYFQLANCFPSEDQISANMKYIVGNKGKYNTEIK